MATLRSAVTERCDNRGHRCRCSTLGQRAQVHLIGRSFGGCGLRDGRLLELRLTTSLRGWLGLGRETHLVCCNSLLSLSGGDAGLGCCPSRAVGRLLALWCTEFSATARTSWRPARVHQASRACAMGTAEPHRTPGRDVLRGDSLNRSLVICRNGYHAKNACIRSAALDIAHCTIPATGAIPVRSQKAKGGNLMSDGPSIPARSFQVFMTDSTCLSGILSVGRVDVCPGGVRR